MMLFAPLFAFVVVLLAVGAKWFLSPRATGIFDIVFPVAATVVSALSVALVFPVLTAVGPPPIAMALATAVLVAVPVALAPIRFRRMVGAAMLAIGFLITLSDIIYWRFFGSLLPLLAVGSASHIGDVWDSVRELFRASDWALLPVLLTALLVVMVRPHPSDFSPRVKRVVIGAVLAATVGGGLVPVVVDVNAWLDHRFSWKVFKWSTPLSHVGIIGAHARDIARVTRESWMRDPPDDATKAKLAAFATSRRVTDPLPAPVDEPLNLIIVQVEAMQGWVVDRTAGDVEITPFLNRLKRERALYFPNIWDQTGASPTSDCEYLVLNSQHPLSQGAVAFRRSGNDFTALPKLLAAGGYQTLSMHAYNKGMWNRAVLHPAWGFQSSLFQDELPKSPRAGWGLSDKAFLRTVVDESVKMKQPFFTFAITLTTHHPYNYIPKRERHVDVSKLGKQPIGDYIVSMRFIDEALEDMFTHLEKTGLAKNTVVVIYGDHDSKLTFSNRTSKNVVKLVDLPESTVDELGARAWRTKKVPLFIVHPHLRTGKTIETAGGQIDIGPTLLHHLGREIPAAFFGRPLLGQPGVAFRYDGAASDGAVVWDVMATPSVCRDATDATIVDEARCEALRETGLFETTMSELVTLEDLSSSLASLTISRPQDRATAKAPTTDDDVDGGITALDAGIAP